MNRQKKKPLRPCAVRVGRLDHSVSRAELERMFRAVAPIRSLRICGKNPSYLQEEAYRLRPAHKGADKLRPGGHYTDEVERKQDTCFAIVEFKWPEAATEAVELLNGAGLDHRFISVSIASAAQPKAKRGRRAPRSKAGRRDSVSSTASSASSAAASAVSEPAEPTRWELALQRAQAAQTSTEPEVAAETPAEVRAEPADTEPVS